MSWLYSLGPRTHPFRKCSGIIWSIFVVLFTQYRLSFPFPRISRLMLNYRVPWTSFQTLLILPTTPPMPFVLHIIMYIMYCIDGTGQGNGNHHIHIYAAHGTHTEHNGIATHEHKPGIRRCFCEQSKQSVQYFQAFTHAYMASALCRRFTSI